MEQNHQPKSNPPAVPVTLHTRSTSDALIQDDDDELFSNIDIDSLDTNVVVRHTTVSNTNVVANTNIVARHATVANTFFDDDDDDDLFFEANIPGNVSVVKPTHNNQEPANTAIMSDDDSIDFAEIENEIQMEIRNEEQRNLINNNVNRPVVVRSVAENEYFDPDLDAIFQSDYSIADNCKTFSNDITDRNYEFKILDCPLVTILQLHSIDANEKTDRSFIVNCEVIRTIDQVRIVSNQYHLKATIKDSSDMELEVTCYFI